MEKTLDKLFPKEIANIILITYYKSMFYDTIKELKKLMFDAYSYKSERYIKSMLHLKLDDSKNFNIINFFYILRDKYDMNYSQFRTRFLCTIDYGEKIERAERRRKERQKKRLKKN